jgi:hypothetical protein
MRVLISLGAFFLVFLVGVKTEWISVSKAALITSDNIAHEDRAYEAVVLGQTRPDATSGELIDAAVARGEISSEQALLYGVYLACGDPRLPAPYRGHDVRPPEKNILWEADVAWASLSPGIQQALHAFFTEGLAAQPGLACRDELARLKGDRTVWWVAGLQEQQPPVLTASNP